MGNALGWGQEKDLESGNLSYSLECDFKLGIEKIPRCITYSAKGPENMYISIQEQGDEVHESVQMFKR